MLLCRPQDIFTFLAPIRPVLVLGAATLLVFIFRMPESTPGGSFRNVQVKRYVLLIGIMIISIPFALYRRGALEVFTGYLNVIFFFFIFFKTVNSPEKLTKIIFLACLGSGLYCISAMILGGVIGKRLSFGGVFDPNDLAFFSLSFLPLNLIFISRDNNLIKRLICISNVAISIVIIFATNSRGGFIAFCVVMFMLLVTKTTTFKLFYKMVFLALILLILSLGIVTVDFDRYRTILNPNDDYNMTAETGRKQVWKVGIKLMLSRPFTGVGISCFNEGVGNDRKERNLPARWQTAHNSLVQIGAETGVIGFILFALLSLKAFAIFGQVRKEAWNLELIKIGEMARLGFVGHFVSGMFLSQAYSVYWAFYIVLSAVLDNLVKRETENPSTSVNYIVDEARSQQ